MKVTVIGNGLSRGPIPVVISEIPNEINVEKYLKELDK